MVYETLFAWDSKLQPKPQMVRDWSTVARWAWSGVSPCAPGLKFHDGQRVTTADVIPSLQRWMQRDVVGQKLAASLTGIECGRCGHLRDQAVQAVSGDAVLAGLRHRPSADHHAGAGSGGGSRPNRSRPPSAPDPFRFNKELADQRCALTVFDRNPDYIPRDEPPDGLAGGRRVKVDRVEWRVIPDASTDRGPRCRRARWTSIEQPALELLPLLQAAVRAFGLQKLTDLSNQTMLRPNSLYPPFNDPRARLALAYIIDQADIMAAGFGDKENWAECRSYFICGGPYGTVAGTAAIKPDLERAKALLKEAGYNGEKLGVPLHPRDRLDRADGGGGRRRDDACRHERGDRLGRLGHHGGAAVQPRCAGTRGGWNLFATGRQRADDAFAADQHRHQHGLQRP